MYKNTKESKATSYQTYKPTKTTYIKIFVVLIGVIIFLSYSGYVLANKYAPKIIEEIKKEFSTNTKQQNAVPTLSTTNKEPRVEVTSSVNTKATTTVIVTNTPKPSTAPTILVNTNTEVTNSFCIKYKITNPKFASNKCYIQSDYSQLAKYLGDYSMQEFTYKAAKDTQKFTCTGEEFFKDQCKDAKKRTEEAKEKMGELESKINNIISRGE